MLYKVLNVDGLAFHGGSGRWRLPQGDQPGEWTRKIADPVMCDRGYHLMDRDHVIYWFGPALFEAEYAPDTTVIGPEDGKFVGAKARLLRRVETYNDRTLRLFAADCAARALNRVANPDPRSIAAAVAAREYAEGRIDISAAYAAYAAAATDAATDATDATDADERTWQVARLWQYLDGPEPTPVPLPEVANA